MHLSKARNHPITCTPQCAPDAHGDPAMLLECGREQRLIGDLLHRLGQGAGSVLTLTGRPGHAQNALVRWGACRARHDGLRVLRAQATPAERDLRHGAVLQLLAALGGPDGSTLNALIGHDGPPPLPGIADVLRCAGIAPTLVVVEDAQWLDPASHTWLQTLLHHLGPHLPLAVLASSCGGTKAFDTEGNAPTGPAHRDAVPARHVVVPALTDRGVAATVRAYCGTPGDEEFVAALTSATAGNPAVLRDVLREFTGLDHPADAAHLPELHALTAGVVGDHTVRALDGLPSEVNSVLRALAVCGDLLDFSRVHALAGARSLSEDRIRTLLASVGLTVSVGDKVHIRFPASKARVIEDMPAGERADLYARAAELTHSCGVNDEDVAHLLLRSPPLGAPWVVPLLRRGFAAALRREDHQRACACLSRALQEPLGPDERSRLTLELAAAEAVARPDAGDRRLGELVRSAASTVELPPNSGGLGVRAIDLGFARGNSEWARRTAGEALPDAAPADREELVALFWLAAVQDDDAPMIPVVPPLPDRPVPPAQAGARAWQLATAGEDADKARKLARIALTGDPRESLMMPRLAACAALFATDDHDEAVHGLEGMLATARRAHLRSLAARILNLRARLHLCAARLDAAERDLDGAERALPPASWHPRALPNLIATRILVSVEAGRPDRARQLAVAPVPAGSEEGVWWPSLLFARARLAAADGDWEEARRLSLESGRRLLRRQWSNPALLSWRPLAAEACLETGDLVEARRLRDEELALADHWGTASARGIARLRTRRLFDDDHDQAVRRTREATALLRDSPTRLAYLWSRLRQAGAETAQGDTAAAARSLAEIAQIVAVHPTSHLATTARTLSVPARPAPVAAVPRTTVVPPGWRAMSEAEKSTVLLAARGHGNRQIAEQLAVSRRTVELRLSNAYRKLQIGGRTELYRFLEALEGPVADAS
ncbi:LuxR C-terminal-related transcriptional regulator [Streptomyces sp. NPDC058000]|uniref:LuxR C-terminal-related transcriptional regulator n=1 Tax=Streptomyces sp. NPDC058000 TaxID=3346299 RepID=UPI0036EC2C1B